MPLALFLALTVGLLTLFLALTVGLLALFLALLLTALVLCLALPLVAFRSLLISFHAGLQCLDALVSSLAAYCHPGKPAPRCAVLRIVSCAPVHDGACGRAPDAAFETGLIGSTTPSVESEADQMQTGA
ncbi:hypothetical protein MNBD_ACTINO01-225 [hydrothermal vent metagenome]|uniref:Uncharacterized protein n=1 Tax=hydrothermal vent metagenome TaxID=652676 RepID=A0A3B0TLP3_9ZZZZ